MNTRSNQQLVATSIEMDISPEEDDKLFNAVNRMLGDCHQVGRETQPEIYHFEKPCICTISRNREIWPYGRIVYDPGFGFSIAASDFEPISFSDSD